jgi:hypothetical protein
MDWLKNQRSSITTTSTTSLSTNVCKRHSKVAVFENESSSRSGKRQLIPIFFELSLEDKIFWLCNIQTHKNWKEEIETMERNQTKVELEALNHFGYDFLPRWLAQCIQHHDWLE